METEGPTPVKQVHKDWAHTRMPLNGVSCPSSSLSVVPNGKVPGALPSDGDIWDACCAMRPPIPRNYDLVVPLKDTRRTTIILSVRIYMELHTARHKHMTLTS